VNGLGEALCLYKTEYYLTSKLSPSSRSKFIYTLLDHGFIPIDDIFILALHKHNLNLIKLIMSYNSKYEREKIFFNKFTIRYGGTTDDIYDIAPIYDAEILAEYIRLGCNI